MQRHLSLVLAHESRLATTPGKLNINSKNDGLQKKLFFLKQYGSWCACHVQRVRNTREYQRHIVQMFCRRRSSESSRVATHQVEKRCGSGMEYHKTPAHACIILYAFDLNTIYNTIKYSKKWSHIFCNIVTTLTSSNQVNQFWITAFPFPATLTACSGEDQARFGCTKPLWWVMRD